jgi:hypothetical protein
MSYGLQTIDFEKKSYPPPNECQLMIEAGHYLADWHIIALNENGMTSKTSEVIPFSLRAMNAS